MVAYPLDYFARSNRPDNSITSPRMLGKRCALKH